VSILAFLAIVLNVVGQIFPFELETNWLDTGYSCGGSTWYKHYDWVCGNYGKLKTRSALLSIVFNVVGVVLAAVLAAAWAQHEEERLSDEASSALA
jgi:ABC-type spermidine/putrescine transport system permease subunit I